MNPDNLTPVGPGNTLSLKHGANSPRVVESVASILAESVTDEAPWLKADIFQPAIWRYARAEARSQLLSAYILSVAEDHPERIRASLWDSASTADSTANRLSDALGLSPVSRARLAAIVSSTEATNAGLDALAERGRAARERREAELKAADTEAPDDAI